MGTLQKIDELEWDCPCAECQEERATGGRWAKGRLAHGVIEVFASGFTPRIYNVDLPPGVVLAREGDAPPPADPYQLKPCPFCGGGASHVDDDDSVVGVCCLQCGATIWNTDVYARKPYDVAASMWNRRA